MESTNDLIGNIPLVLGKRVLNPGQTINVLNECYTPTSPDSDQTDPDLAALLRPSSGGR